MLFKRIVLSILVLTLGGALSLAQFSKPVGKQYNTIHYLKSFDTSLLKTNIGVIGFDYSQSEPATYFKKFGGNTIEAIDIVLTQYPLDLEDWIIPIDTLIKRRLNQLEVLGVSVDLKNTFVRLVFQDACMTEASAKKHFHGIILYPENNFVNEDFLGIEIYPGRIYPRSKACGSRWTKTMSIVNYQNSIWICNQNIGVFQSSDSGLSFQPRNKGLSHEGGTQTLLVFKGELYMASNMEGIFRFNPKSGEWDQVIQLHMDEKQVWHLFTNGEKIYATINFDGLYGSLDGRTWNRIPVVVNENGKQQEIKVIGMATMFFRGEHIYLTSGKKLYHSRDDGKTWRNIRLPFENEIVVTRYMGGNDSLLFLAADFKGFYVSKNNGLTWERLMPKEGMDVTSVYLFDNHILFLGGRDLRAILDGREYLILDEPVQAISVFDDFYLVGSANGVVYRIRKNYVQNYLKGALQGN